MSIREELDGISVIIPIYNASKYLHRAIDSVLNQTYKDIELVLVNDGSKDDSLSICREYEKREGRVVVIDKANGGVSSARNTGIERATKKYIAFMDNDDYMIPTYLETMHKYISEDGGRDLLVANAFHIDESVFGLNMELLKDDGHDSVHLVDLPNEEELSRQFVSLDRSHFATIWNKLFVRDIIMANNVRFEKIQSEDEMFSYNYLRYIKSIRTIMGYRGYCWLRSEKSLSHSHQYLLELDWLCKMIQINNQIQERLHIRDVNYIIERQLLMAYIVKTNVFSKGYYKDTHKSRDERFHVFRKIANSSYFKAIDSNCLCTKDRWFYYYC